MTGPLDSPFRLALLASAQIVPNLECALALEGNPLLKSVHIYCSNSQQNSIGPGRSLQSVLSSTFDNSPTASIAIDLAVGPSSRFEDVLAWFRALQLQYPKDVWVLNATGGTKPMGAAFIAQAADPSVRGVLYREMSDSAWQVLTWEEGGVATRNADEYGMREAGACLDRIGLIDLVGAQLGQDRVSLKCDRKSLYACTDFERLLDKWEKDPTQSLGKCWDSAELRLPPNPSEGFKFENLVDGVLSACGFVEIVRSLEIRWKEKDGTEKPRNEIDLLVKHKGRRALLDLKLTPPTGTKAVTENDQIPTAVEVTRQVAGIDARSYMVRPNWLPDEGRTSFAAMHRVTLIDAAGMPTLIDTIANDLRLAEQLPPLAQRFQALFLARRRAGLITAGSSAALTSDREHAFVIDIEAEMATRQSVQGCNWSVLRKGTLLEWHVWRQPKGSPVRPDADLAALLTTARRSSRALIIKRITVTDGRFCVRIEGFAKGQSRIFLNHLQGWLESGTATLDMISARALLLPQLAKAIGQPLSGKTIYAIENDTSGGHLRVDFPPSDRAGV